MIISLGEIWLVVGIIFILIEFSTLPGIGFLFVGLGAMTSSVIFYFYPEIQNYQVASVAFSSLAWFLILWWPLKAFVYNKNNHSDKEYFDIIGMQVEVAYEDIKPGNLGQVYWSGTIMNAKLSSGETISRVGDKLFIVSAKGNILICKHSTKPNLK